jgi:hypothetical protein
MVPSPTFVDSFRENPLFIALAVLLSLPGFLAGAIGIVLSSRRAAGTALGAVALVCGLSAVGAGAMGMMIARSHTLGAVSAPGLSAIDRERILDYGNAAATKQLEAGIVIGALPALLGLVAFVLARGRK